MSNNLILNGNVYNVPALLMVVKYADRMTKEPICEATLMTDGYKFHCLCCSFRGSAEDIADECLHDHDCTWRLLKESVANVDNEGYE